MGKGKGGCGSPLLIDQAAIQSLVESGQAQAALEALRESDLRQALRSLEELAANAERGEDRSSYRQLLATLLFEARGNWSQLERHALWTLHRDLSDPETPQKFRELSEAKIQAAVGYQIRPWGKGSDIGEIRKARQDSVSVNIATTSPPQEVSMLRQAFPDLEFIDDIDEVNQRLALGRGTSTGIGYRFDRGPLLRAVDEGKVCAIMDSDKYGPQMESKITDLLRDGEIEDPDGRVHKAASGFMLVFIHEERRRPVFSTDRSFNFNSQPRK